MANIPDLARTRNGCVTVFLGKNYQSLADGVLRIFPCTHLPSRTDFYFATWLQIWSLMTTFQKTFSTGTVILSRRLLCLKTFATGRGSVLLIKRNTGVNITVYLFLLVQN